MVDPIGMKAGTVADRRLAPVASNAPVAAATPVKTSEPVAKEVAATALASDMAGKAPVDLERVSRIRKAVQDGRFPLVPSTIADRLIALKYEWNPNG